VKQDAGGVALGVQVGASSFAFIAGRNDALFGSA
jgi:hypothetical protein